MKTKEEILGIIGKYGDGGIEHFNGLSAKSLKELIKLGFADPEDTQNESPSIAEFLKFMEKYHNVEAHGYAVSPNRSDERVSIEGLETKNRKEELSKEFILDFTKKFRQADDFEVDEKHAFCWYD